MVDHGLVVVGSRPSSQLDTVRRPGSAISSRRVIPSEFLQTYNVELEETERNFSKVRNSAYEDELFGKGHGEKSNIIDYKQYNIRGRNSVKQTTALQSELQSRNNTTYGPPTVRTDRPPSKRTDRPPSGRIPAAVTRSRRSDYQPTCIHNSSYVDETLFGPPLEEASFSAPWEKQSRRKSFHIFDCTDYKNKEMKNKGQMNPSEKRSEPIQMFYSSKPRSVNSRVRGPTHRKTYVDETLFGEKPLQVNDWPPPWEQDKRQKHQKLILFDGFDYKVTAMPKDVSTLKETIIKRVNSTGNLSNKPVWR